MNNVLTLPTHRTRETGLIEAAGEFMDRKELAELWSVSVSTVDRLRKEGMPAETFGKRVVRFRLADVESWRRGRAA